MIIEAIHGSILIIGDVTAMVKLRISLKTLVEDSSVSLEIDEDTLCLIIITHFNNHFLFYFINVVICCPSNHFWKFLFP
jgi:hypothetical protein